MRTLVALAAAASVGLQAAPAAAQQIRVQPQVGVNFANVSEVSELAAGFGIDTKMRIAFHGGVGILFGLSEQLSIGTGGYYSQQGLKLTQTGEPDVTLKLDYVKVPLTLSAAFPSGGGVTPFVFAGPMVGFKAACKASGGGVSIDCDAGDLAVKSIDFGALLGGGIGIQAGTGMVTLNGWYNLGLTNIDDEAVSGDPKPKNRVFGFSVGYAFPLGGGM